MRSMLFVPADSEKKLAKGMTSGADALILDIEDSVAPANKPAARRLASGFLSANRPADKRPLLYVRINPLDGPHWSADLEGVMAAAPDGIMLPKPRSGEEVQRLAIALDHAEQQHRLALGSTRIVAIATETPAALLQMHTFLDASPRLAAITWGAEDLSAVVGSSATREADGRSWTSPYQLARNLCLMTAVAAGRQPIDTVYVNFRDAEGFAEECRIAARDGFTGKMAIHPDQVAAINAAFTPAKADIAWAREIVELFQANPDAGTIGLRGQMIDRPHLLRAERILDRARLAGAA